MPVRARPGTDALGWCAARLVHLTGLVGDLAAIEPDAVYRQGAWTALKEIFLATYNGWIYSRIVPNFFDHWYYVDPLCGPGLVQIQETGDLIAGSPIIAAATARTPFTKLFLSDSNPQCRAAVAARLERLKVAGIPVNYETPSDDCNQLLLDLGSRLPEVNSNFLAFIDLQGMEVHWESMSALLSRLGDVIVTFNTGAIQRPWGLACNGDPAYVQAMTKFYGSSEWEDASSADDLPDLYLDTVAATGRRMTTRIRIRRTDPPLRQDILFAARETKGGSPWFDAVENRIRPRVEAHTDDSVRQALDIITGRQSTFDWFFQSYGDGQRTLKDFT